MHKRSWIITGIFVLLLVSIAGSIGYLKWEDDYRVGVFWTRTPPTTAQGMKGPYPEHLGPRSYGLNLAWGPPYWSWSKGNLSSYNIIELQSSADWDTSMPGGESICEYVVSNNADEKIFMMWSNTLHGSGPSDPLAYTYHDPWINTIDDCGYNLYSTSNVQLSAYNLGSLWFINHTDEFTANEPGEDCDGLTYSEWMGDYHMPFVYSTNQASGACDWARIRWDVAGYHKFQINLKPGSIGGYFVDIDDDGSRDVTNCYSTATNTVRNTIETETIAFNTEWVDSIEDMMQRVYDNTGWLSVGNQQWAPISDRDTGEMHESYPFFDTSDSSNTVTSGAMNEWFPYATNYYDKPEATSCSTNTGSTAWTWHDSMKTYITVMDNTDVAGKEAHPIYIGLVSQTYSGIPDPPWQAARFGVGSIMLDDGYAAWDEDGGVYPGNYNAPEPLDEFWVDLISTGADYGKTANPSGSPDTDKSAYVDWCGAPWHPAYSYSNPPETLRKKLDDGEDLDDFGWYRQYENCLVLVNPKSTSLEFDGLGDEEWCHFKGNQDSVINDGSSITAAGDITLVSKDAVILIPCEGEEPTPSPMPTVSGSTVTPTPVWTGGPSTNTPTPTPTSTPTPTNTPTATPTATPTVTPTHTDTPTITPTREFTRRPPNPGSFTGKFPSRGDASLIASSPTTRTGNRLWRLHLGDNQRYSTVMKFDFSSISTSATVDSAILNLYVTEATAEDYIVTIHPIQQEWYEYEVTWNQRKSGTNWTTAGMFSSTDVDLTQSWTFTVSGVGNYSIDITDLVADWVDGTDDNYGIVMWGNPNGRISVASKEYAFGESGNPYVGVSYYEAGASSPTDTPTPTPTPTPSLNVEIEAGTNADCSTELEYMITLTAGSSGGNYTVQFVHHESVEFLNLGMGAYYHYDPASRTAYIQVGLFGGESEILLAETTAPSLSGTTVIRNVAIASEGRGEYVSDVVEDSYYCAWPTNTPTPTSTHTPTRTATPTHTPTVTATATPNPVPTSQVVINEICPVAAYDYNRSGDINELDDFIELAEVHGSSADISGWKIEVYELGSKIGVTYLIPENTILLADDYLAINGFQSLREDTEYRDYVKFRLPDDYVCVTLLDSSDNIKDSLCYMGKEVFWELPYTDYDLSGGACWSRYPDGDAVLYEYTGGSPGSENVPSFVPTSTPTPTATYTPTPTP